MTTNPTPVRIGNRWVFPDGKTLPVIAGGDETATITLDAPASAEEMKALLVKARDLAARAEAREDGAFTPEEQVEIKGYIDRAAAIKRVLDADKKAKRSAADTALLDQLKGLDGNEPISASDAKALNDWALRNATVGIDASTKSLGDRFVESEEFKALIDRFPSGRIPDKSRLTMDPVDVGSMKALLGTSTLPGMTPVDSRGAQGPFVWGRDLMIRNVITVGQTDSDTVEYARQLAMTNNAAPVPEATTDAADETPTTAEGYKPQSSFTFEKVSEPVKTIAHWLAATRKSLSDVGQLRTLIDSFLRFGLDEELEDQIVSGDGTGENFDGILTVSGTQSQAYDTSPIVTIRKGITLVRTVGRARATAVALNPADDEALDLATDLQGRFFGNGPFGTGPSTIWGLPRVVTEAVPAGTAIVADWRFAVLWDRMAATILASDSHADFFIRNLVAVLAEMRAAFGIVRPAAFVIADLTSA